MFWNRSDKNFTASGDQPTGAEHTHTHTHTHTIPSIKVPQVEPNTRITIAATVKKIRIFNFILTAVWLQ